MKEVFFEVEGFETHALIWNESCMKQRLVLVIPGNPGVGLFYVPFGQALASSLLDASVVVVSHSGHHSARDQRKSEAVSLQDQVNHKEAVLRHFKSKQVVLIGHSIGSFIVLELLGRGFNAWFSFFLCPTFSRIYEGLSPLVKIVVSVPGLSWLVANLVHYMPVSVKKAMISAASEHDTLEIKLVVEDHLDFYCVRNILSMAKDEVRHVRELQKDHIATLSRTAKSSLLIFSQIDHYVPLWYVDELKVLLEAII